MALWQWDILLLPRNQVKAEFLSLDPVVGLGRVESVNWEFSLLEQTLATFFEAQLPCYSTPWAKESRSWGSDDGDRITLDFEIGRIAWIAVRVDLRNLNNELLRSLAGFCRKTDLVFYSIESGKFIDADIELVLDAVRSSRKMTFVTNPERFFEDRGHLERVDREARKKLSRLKDMFWSK